MFMITLATHCAQRQAKKIWHRLASGWVLDSNRGCLKTSITQDNRNTCRLHISINEILQETCTCKSESKTMKLMKHAQTKENVVTHTPYIHPTLCHLLLQSFSSPSTECTSRDKQNCLCKITGIDYDHNIKSEVTCPFKVILCHLGPFTRTPGEQRFYLVLNQTNKAAPVKFKLVTEIWTQCAYTR